MSTPQGAFQTIDDLAGQIASLKAQLAARTAEYDKLLEIVQAYKNHADDRSAGCDRLVDSNISLRRELAEARAELENRTRTSFSLSEELGDARQALREAMQRIELFAKGVAMLPISDRAEEWQRWLKAAGEALP